MREGDYLLAESGADPEHARLALLESVYDSDTRRRLAPWVADGARCLELGAGRGSIARWLASAVGAQGRVVAADIDCRFLTDLPENVEVRELDVRTGELEPGTFDLVHARALLMHLPDPVAVVGRMVAALRPGGVLLAEEGDYGLLAYGGHPDALWATDVNHRLLEALASARVMNAYLGRVLPGLLADAGLEVLGGQVDSTVARAGEPAFEFQRLSAESAGSGLVEAGVLTERDRDRARAVTSAPGTVLTTAAMVSVWGRR